MRLFSKALLVRGFSSLWAQVRKGSRRVVKGHIGARLAQEWRTGEGLPTMERMSADTQVRRLLTIREVAARLSLSESTVRRRIEMGELPAHRLGSGPQPPVRVDPDELEAWIAASPPKPPAGAAVTGRSPQRGL